MKIRGPKRGAREIVINQGVGVRRKGVKSAHCLRALKIIIYLVLLFNDELQHFAVGFGEFPELIMPK